MVEFYKMEPTRWDMATASLTLEQEAAYLRICNSIYIHEGPIPANERVLAGLFRVSARRARRILSDLVDAGKLTVEDGKIHNEFCANLLSSIQSLSEKRRELGKLGGKASGKVRNAAAKALKNNDPPEAFGSTKTKQTRLDKIVEEPSTDVLGQIGAADPPSVQSASQWIYAKGKELLSAAAKPSKNPGGMISKWLREHGEDAVMSALKACDAKRTPEPIAFITGILSRAERPLAGQTEAGKRRKRQNDFFDGIESKLKAMENGPDQAQNGRGEGNLECVSEPDGTRSGNLCIDNDSAFGRVS